MLASFPVGTSAFIICILTIIHMITCSIRTSILIIIIIVTISIRMKQSGRQLLVFVHALRLPYTI